MSKKWPIKREQKQLIRDMYKFFKREKFIRYAHQLYPYLHILDSYGDVFIDKWEQAELNQLRESYIKNRKVR